MSTPSQVRCVTCEDAEINQYERRVSATSDEAEQLRTEIAALLGSLEQLDIEDVQTSLRLADLRSLNSELIASLVEKTNEIRLLEREIQSLQNSCLISPADRDEDPATRRGPSVPPLAPITPRLHNERHHKSVFKS
ncbi:hypothetical protein F5879DRAFT_985309 [Lentinula edodes]|nr:hypothetical protein F5051DRAFT_444702 [Lentinula edodes]KAJ3908729.1 hypothetical protein F5879DRAFT_985309 [Lentinula edodes]